MRSPSEARASQTLIFGPRARGRRSPCACHASKSRKRDGEGERREKERACAALLGRLFLFDEKRSLCFLSPSPRRPFAFSLRGTKDDRELQSSGQKKTRTWSPRGAERCSALPLLRGALSPPPMSSSLLLQRPLFLQLFPLLLSTSRRRPAASAAAARGASSVDDSRSPFCLRGEGEKRGAKRGSKGC